MRAPMKSLDINIHNIAPIACEQCDKSFPDQRSLNKQVENIHRGKREAWPRIPKMSQPFQFTEYLEIKRSSANIFRIGSLFCVPPPFVHDAKMCSYFVLLLHPGDLWDVFINLIVNRGP